MSQLKQRNNMDKGLDRIMDVVEDHAKVRGFLSALCWYIKGSGSRELPFMPNFNDDELADELTTVAEAVGACKKNGE